MNKIYNMLIGNHQQTALPHTSTHANLKHRDNPPWKSSTIQELGLECKLSKGPFLILASEGFTKELCCGTLKFSKCKRDFLPQAPSFFFCSFALPTQIRCWLSAFRLVLSVPNIPRGQPTLKPLLSVLPPTLFCFLVSPLNNLPFRCFLSLTIFSLLLSGDYVPCSLLNSAEPSQTQSEFQIDKKK